MSKKQTAHPKFGHDGNQFSRAIKKRLSRKDNQSFKFAARASPFSLIIKRQPSFKLDLEICTLEILA